METIKNTGELIDSYIDGELKDEEKLKFQKEIQSKPELLEEYITRKKIDNALKKHEIIELRRQLKDLYSGRKTVSKQPAVVNFKWYWAAALIAILFGVGFVLYHISTFDTILNKEENIAVQNKELTEDPESLLSEKPIEESDKSHESRANESSQNETDKKTHEENPEKYELIASNFQESAYLESFIGEIRSEEVEVYSPLPLAQFKKDESILFKWDSSIKDALKLIVLTNNEEIVFNKTMHTDEYLLDQAYEPGLYYWKLVSEDELIYIHKFEIR